MNPRPDVPRSVFGMPHTHKTAFDFSFLYPILVEEVLPGDTWKATITTAARTAIPLVPLQDSWHLEFFTFFVPMRLVWTNARKFWGEQDNPADSINFTIPQTTSPAGGYVVGTLWDYMGLPTVGQVLGGNTVSNNVLPARAYSLIWSAWFRDENLQNTASIAFGDGPDAANNYILLRRGKRFDYFTQALPWPQKGNTAITLPLGTTAPVKTQSTATVTGAQSAMQMLRATDGGAAPSNILIGTGTGGSAGQLAYGTNALTAQTGTLYPSNLFADLTTATAATINQLRQAITLQQYLEKDARGGTRYTEFVFNHFGVKSPDARLQRPEFIGGGHANILTTAIPQTSATGLTGSTTPAGNLSASGHVTGRTGFTYSSTEHGYILTLVSARAELSYSQGMRKMWSRSTRYDYPVPLLANLGEQTLLNREIYADGSVNDANVFGYVPRWDEYRHIPSKITGLYRPRSTGNIAYWHSSENFLTLPALNATWIQDNSETVVERNFTAGAATANQQILADFYFDVNVARPLPAYGIPGLTRF